MELRLVSFLLNEYVMLCYVMTYLLLICRPRTDEKLSWFGWLTYSDTRHLQVERRTKTRTHQEMR